MGNALLAGVSGLQAHQKMLDVAGNNLSNINTTGFKSSRVTFAEMLSETIRDASAPTENTGGTNPVEAGSGVQLASVDRDVSHGDMQSTGKPLDMAIEGEGYFTLSDGEQDVYTRVGAFAIDADYYLVDPSTGYRVQRTGSEGLSEGFQSSQDSNIRVPMDTSLPASATTSISFSGNLKADETNPSTQKLTSGTQYTVSGGSAAGTTLLSDLDQASGLTDPGTITVSGTDRSGAAITDRDVTVTPGVTTVADLLSEIETAFGGEVTASITGGEIVVQDTQNGFSRTDLNLSYAGPGSLELPGYFQVDTPGGEASKKTNVNIFDAKGVSHTLSASFVKTDTPDTWDMLINSLSGDVASISNRRVEDITFGADGSFSGVSGSDELAFEFQFGSQPAPMQVAVDAGTTGGFDGLTQTGDKTTAAASGQDGYAPGSLSSMSVSREGVLVGVFDNGLRRNIAALQVATFQNPAGLTSVGNNYYTTSANSGDAVPKKALSGGAGAIRGSSLEKSNVDTAKEFVNLIQAQNGYQANARTITVANDMLRELTQLIR